MDKYSYIHQVETLQKVNIASMFLEQDQHVWYQWLRERKSDYVIYWYFFTKEIKIQYPHRQGFKLAPRNHYILKIDMR